MQKNNVFSVFFILVTFLKFFLTFFLIFQTFFIFKVNVGKVQSGKQINKKRFQNNSSKIQSGFINNRILYPEIRM